jgi:hypothetical protein
MRCPIAPTQGGFAWPIIARSVTIQKGQIEAVEVSRDWLINRESLLAYKHQMDVLGPEKHNPWREDLTDQERGRRGD